MTEQELRQLFKSKLDHRELAPDPSSWDVISAALDRRKALLMRRQWSIGLSAAAAVTAAVFLVVNPVGTRTDTLVQPQTAPTVSVEASDAVDPISGNTLSAEAPVASSSSTSTNTASEPIVSTPAARSGTSGSASGGSAPFSTASTGIDPSVAASGQQGRAERDAPYGTPGWMARSKSPNVLESDISQQGDVPVVRSLFWEQDRPEERESETYHRMVRMDPHWSISVNGHMALGQKLGDTENGVSGWGVGVGVDRYFESGWSLTSALSFARRSDVGLQHQFEGATYGFGAVRDVLSVQATGFDALEVPLSVGWGLGAGHRVRAGWYAAWLFNFGSEAQHLHQAEGSQEWIELPTPDYDLTPYFSSYDHGGLMAWDWETGRWGLGLEYRHGLVDLTPSFGALGTEDFNRTLRINLSIDLDE
ncbi:hypothetical protein GC167_06150 [bacterium]|nr:hypothetical protein [bacterium]